MAALPVPLSQDFSADPSRILVSEYFWSRSARDPNATPNAFKHFSHALSAFRRFLGDRPPTLAHVTSDTLDRLAAWIIARGRKPSTAARIVQELVNLGRAAAAEGLLREPPAVRKIHKRGAIERRPLSIDEIERLLAVCRCESGDVAGVPAGHWWTCLILLTINLQLSARSVLAIPRSGLRVRKLCIELAPGDGFVYALNSLTWSALEKLPPDSPRLLPSAYERLDMVYYHCNRLFRLAAIPRQRGLSFDRLRAAALDAPGLLDQISEDRIAALAEQIRAAVADRLRSRAQQSRRRSKAVQRSVPKVRRLPKVQREIVTITHDSSRRLRTWFREVYQPKRLLGASPVSIGAHESLCTQLANFSGCEPTIDVLESPAFADRFLQWKLAGGASAYTVESYRRRILALHRYARRKKYLTGDWPDIEPIRKPKRRPTAWSLDEFGRLLAAAARLPGHHDGLAWSKLLPAMCLTVYDAGLRIGALLSLRCDELSSEGLLICPAEVSKTLCEQAWRISPQTQAAIEAIGPAVCRPMLFNGPCREPGKKCNHRDLQQAKRKFTRRLRLALKTAGLAATRRDLWHKIRRTSCTWAAAATSIMEASEHLGHGSIQTTKTFYLDDSKLDRSVVARLPRPAYQPEPQPVAGLLEYRPAIAAGVESEGGSR